MATTTNDPHIVLNHQDDARVGEADSLEDARKIARDQIKKLAGSVFDIYEVSMPDGKWRWVEMVTAQDEEVLATYTLQLIGPNRFSDGPFPVEDMVPPTLLRETEENLTDLMPEGYRIEIKERSDG